MELILTIMSDDRPGVAEQLARTIESHQGNWLESRLATMAGKFAGIVRVELPDSQYEAAAQSLSALIAQGVSVRIDQVQSQAAEHSRHTVEIVGNDRAGIVREVTHALAMAGVNVIDLQTEIEPASMSGGSLFRANVEFTLTADQSMDVVVKALEALSPDLMVDY